MQYLKISKIEQTEKQDRYDLTISTTNNFFANGILIHNTSARTGRMLRKKTLNGFQKFWNRTIGKLGLQFMEEDWCYVTGTRRVVLDPRTVEDKGFYSGNNFRREIHNKIKTIGLHKGETIYYEIVGYTSRLQNIQKTPSVRRISTPIMSSHSVSKDLVKKGIITKEDYESFVKKYGETVTYSYGCAPSTYKILAYRITQTSDCGHAVELDYYQFIRRCKELGLDIVPPLLVPFIYHEDDQQKLIDICKGLMEDRPSTLDPSHPMEGVVVRVDDETPTNYKIKSFWFRVLEGLVKESDTYVDTEEVS